MPSAVGSSFGVKTPWGKVSRRAITSEENARLGMFPIVDSKVELSETGLR